MLRVVNIRGAPDEMVEECYTSVQYHKLMVKQISEIFIEIRSSFSGALIPFQFGVCTLTLHFKKMANSDHHPCQQILYLYHVLHHLTPPLSLPLLFIADLLFLLSSAKE